MKELTPRQVQEGELNILRVLDQLCRKLDLKYYLMWGTLIGAARHQGFIPWDDDLDVGMPRPDFDRLMDYLKLHAEELLPLKLMSCDTNPDYIYPIPRLCDTRYYIDYQGATDYGLGLFVDIYPLDGCGQDEHYIESTYRKRLNYDRLTCLAGSKSFQRSAQGRWRDPIKYLMFRYAKSRGPHYFVKKLEKLATACSYEDSSYISLMVWDDQRKPFPKEWFADTVELPFEGGSFLAPKEYDKVLRSYYGDYMQLPPEEERIGHHYYTAYLKDESCTDDGVV